MIDFPSMIFGLLVIIKWVLLCQDGSFGKVQVQENLMDTIGI